MRLKTNQVKHEVLPYRWSCCSMALLGWIEFVTHGCWSHQYIIVCYTQISACFHTLSNIFNHCKVVAHPSSF